MQPGERAHELPQVEAGQATEFPQHEAGQVRGACPGSVGPYREFCALATSIFCTKRQDRMFRAWQLFFMLNLSLTDEQAFASSYRVACLELGHFYIVNLSVPAE